MRPISSVLVLLASLVVALVTALVAAPGAHAWTWPAAGQVLRPFSLGADTYAGGQHRGVDIGAELGGTVLAPAAGTVSFVGSIPHGGRAVTIQTADGYAVTLLQLASTNVLRGSVVEEGAVVGVVGESADAVTTAPHIHLGIRVADDPDGYVDPLGFLPAVVTQPVPAPSPPVPEPEPPAQPVAAPAPQPSAAADPVVEHAAPVVPEAPEATVEPATTPATPSIVKRVAAPAARAPVRTAVEPPHAAESAAPRRGVHTAKHVAEPVSARDVARPFEQPASAAHARPAADTAAASPKPVATPKLAAAPSPMSVPRDPSRPAGPFVQAERQVPGASPGYVLPLGLAAVLLSALAATAASVRRRRPGTEEPARIMVGDDGPPTAEDPGRGRVAVCERPSAHRPRGGLRRPVGHLRPVSPASGQRRADGERNRRARHTGHGGRGRGRSLAA
jgi:hypothetical protein